MQHINMTVHRAIQVYVVMYGVLWFCLRFCSHLVPLSRSLTAHRSITAVPGQDKRLHLCIVFFFRELNPHTRHRPTTFPTAKFLL